MPQLVEETDYSDLHVLVADDDEDICTIIKYVLTNMPVGHIQLVYNGSQALERFNEPGTPLDLIICDWMMPEYTGLDVLKVVRAKRPELPFLMLTAKST